ncbi:MAG: HD domain-containing protein [Lawsonibacter sp.]|nr:HD domain-containing protein [Lawsonibacter sp.]
MKAVKNRASIWAFIITFAILIICFIGVYLYCINQSAKLHTYVFAKDRLSISQEGLSVLITISKQWDDQSLHSDISKGAQYDGVLTNNSGLAFKNWSANLVFSENMMIDSSWNGDFSSRENQLTFVATGLPATVAPYSSTTFGAVIYAIDLMSLESYTLSGYWIINVQDLPIFWVMTAFFVLWVITLIAYIVIQARTAAYRKRQELDSKIIMQSMNTLTSFIDAKDTYTKGHSTRVAEYAAEIAHRIKMNKDEITQIYYIALMHDCGKIGIPDAVLKKNCTLTNEEYNLIKSHTTTGDELLQNFSAVPGIRDGAHFHHERFDGAGYPSGLIGMEIPLCARIICIADSFDAMSSNRCYRSSLSAEHILSELTQNAGKQFDPDLIYHMIQMIEDGFVEKTLQKYPITNNN